MHLKNSLKSAKMHNNYRNYVSQNAATSGYRDKETNHETKNSLFIKFLACFASDVHRFLPKSSVFRFEWNISPDSAKSYKLYEIPRTRKKTDQVHFKNELIITDCSNYRNTSANLT